MGDQLSEYDGDERKSVFTTLHRQLRFLDSPLIANSTLSSSFDPADLKNGNVSAFYIAPIEFMRSNPSLVRMWLGCTIRRIQSCGLDERNKVHVIVDEAKMLEKFDCIEDLLCTGRGSGFRCHLIYQSMSQLRETFPNGQDGNVLANTTQVFWSANDAPTCDYLSVQGGDFTAIVESGGTSTGSSRSVSQGGQPQSSTGGSYNSNSNWGLQQRRLIKPEDVRTLPERTAITLHPGMPPIMTTMVRYFEEKNLWRRDWWLSRMALSLATLTVSIVFLIFGLIVATELTSAFNTAQQQWFNAPSAIRVGPPMHRRW